MKKIFLIFFFLFSTCELFAQVNIGADGRVHSSSTGGTVTLSNELTIATDTTSRKTGFAFVGGQLYSGNGTYYTITSGLQLDSTRLAFLAKNQTFTGQNKFGSPVAGSSGTWSTQALIADNIVANNLTGLGTANNSVGSGVNFALTTGGGSPTYAHLLQLGASGQLSLWNFNASRNTWVNGNQFLIDGNILMGSDSAAARSYVRSYAQPTGSYLVAGNNLADVTNVSTALSNLNGVALSGNQTINGVKTFVQPISASGINNLYGSSIAMLNGSNSATYLVGVPTFTTSHNFYFPYKNATGADTFALQSDLSSYQKSLTLTTTGTSGAATLTGSTLNIPQYSGATNIGSSFSGLGRTVNLTSSTGTGTSFTLPHDSLSYTSGASIGILNSNSITLSSLPNSSLVNSSVSIAGNSTSLGGSVGLDAITGVSSNGYLKRTGTNTLTNISSIGNADLTNSSVTVNGNSVSLGGSTTINNYAITGSDTTITYKADSSTMTLNCNGQLYKSFYIILTGTGRTLSFVNAVQNGVYTVKVYQDATGGRTITTYTNGYFAGGTVPTLTSTASALDILCGWYDGNKMMWNANLNYK
jgi:hypothetical protein